MVSPLFLLVLCYTGRVLSRLPARGVRLVLAVATLEMTASRLLTFFLTRDLDKPYLEVWDKRQKIHDILAENGLAPDETLFIGDMQHDIETARHGGIH